jgi:uncharacterized protein (DUF433 family)
MAPQDAELIARYIEPNPHRSGPQGGRLRGYGVAVWALVADWKGADGDAVQVASDYEVPQEAVEAALAYYRQHQDLIDARLALNEAAFAG